MRGAAALLVLLALLAACGRPLSPNERAWLSGVHGEALEMDRVRLHAMPYLDTLRISRPPRPRVACRERIGPPETGPVVTGGIAGFVYAERIFLAPPWWERDYLPDYPEGLELATAMLLAHELTHVWQWQQRGRTGYHPFRAAAEHEAVPDPYLFEIEGGRDFLDYGWEQQGALVEEYVCCRALAPNGARTERLRQLLAPVFPGLARREAVPRGAIRLPSAQADLPGICD